jgi:hypothetical protein
MHKIIYMMGLIILLLPLTTNAQPEIKQSDTKELSADSWNLFQQHNNITFLGKLGNCNGQDILTLKVINNNPEAYEVRISYLNGTKRIAPSVISIPPRQEIEIACAGSGGSMPVYLPGGKSIRIETQTIKRK